MPAKKTTPKPTRFECFLGNEWRAWVVSERVTIDVSFPQNLAVVAQTLEDGSQVKTYFNLNALQAYTFG